MRRRETKLPGEYQQDQGCVSTWYRWIAYTLHIKAIAQYLITWLYLKQGLWRSKSQLRWILSQCDWFHFKKQNIHRDSLKWDPVWQEGEGTIHNRRGIMEESVLVGILTLGFQPPELWQNEWLLCWLPVCGTMLWQPYQQNTGTSKTAALSEKFVVTRGRNWRTEWGNLVRRVMAEHCQRHLPLATSPPLTQEGSRECRVWRQAVICFGTDMLPLMGLRITWI